MRNPAKYDLVGDRGVALNDTLTWVGQDFTGCGMRAQVRMVPDAPGSPLVSLALASGLTLSYGGTATVTAHIAAGRLPADITDQVNPATGAKFAGGDSVALSVIALHVDYLAMSSPPGGAIPLPAETGDSVVLAWDLLISGGGVGFEDKFFTGAFTVRGTVVQ